MSPTLFSSNALPIGDRHDTVKDIMTFPLTLVGADKVAKKFKYTRTMFDNLGQAITVYMSDNRHYNNYQVRKASICLNSTEKLFSGLVEFKIFGMTIALIAYINCHSSSDGFCRQGQLKQRCYTLPCDWFGRWRNSK